MIKSNKYLRGILLLLSGSVVSQGITFIFIPIISRLVSPEQMGAYTLILSLVNMFGSVICARYDMVIISGKNEREVFNLISLCLAIGLISSTFVSIGFYVYTNTNSELTEIIGSWSLIVFPILLVYAITNVLNSYNNRHGEYGLISQVGIIRVTAQGILQTLSGFMGLGSFGQTIAYLFSNAFGLRRQSKRLLKNANMFKSVTRKRIFCVMKRHKNQPIFSVPAIFFNAASYSLLPFLINTMFDAREVGLYSVSFRLLGVPLALISANFSRVFFQRASEQYNSSKDFRRLYARTAAILLAIAVPMVVVLFIWGREIIVIVFGSEWANAGMYVRILAPMFGIRLIVSALSVSLIITKKQVYDMILQSLFMLSTVIAYFISVAMRYEIKEFIILVSVLFSANYVMYGILGYYFSKVKIRKAEET